MIVSRNLCSFFLSSSVTGGVLIFMYGSEGGNEILSFEEITEEFQ